MYTSNTCIYCMWVRSTVITIFSLACICLQAVSLTIVSASRTSLDLIQTRKLRCHGVDPGSQTCGTMKTAQSRALATATACGASSTAAAKRGACAASAAQFMLAPPASSGLCRSKPPPRASPLGSCAGPTPHSLPAARACSGCVLDVRPLGHTALLEAVLAGAVPRFAPGDPAGAESPRSALSPAALCGCRAGALWSLQPGSPTPALELPQAPLLAASLPVLAASRLGSILGLPGLGSGTLDPPQTPLLPGSLLVLAASRLGLTCGVGLGLGLGSEPAWRVVAALHRGRLSTRRRPGHSSVKGSAAARRAAAARSSFSPRTICGAAYCQ